MLINMAKYRIELNDLEALQVLLQETYDESCKNIVMCQTQMNKLQNSVALNEEAMDAKTKYSKAMNDLINTMDKAIRTKLDIAKIMLEVQKESAKNSEAIYSESELDWDSLKDNIDEKEVYKLS